VMKLLYSRGDLLGRDLSEALGLKFSLIEELIEFLKRQHFIQRKHPSHGRQHFFVRSH